MSLPERRTSTTLTRVIQQNGYSEAPPALLREWILCAIAAAAARFVPVPLLDDAIRERATRVAVARTLRAHGRRYPSDAVEPLYGDIDSGWRSTLRYVSSVPRKVVLFPVRKYVAIFGAVRGVPTDVMNVLLLARTVHRCLARGGLLDADDRDALHDEARRIRLAHLAAIEGVDLQLLRVAVAEGLSHGRGLTGAAVAYARALLERDDEERRVTPEQPVVEGAERVEDALRRPEISQLLAELDARFDERLAAS